MLVAAGTIGVTPLLIALVGGGGITSAVVTWVKVRPDINSASVTQAQGAMEVMQELQNELRKSLDEERAQSDHWHQKYVEERERRLQIEAEWGPFPPSGSA